MSGRPLLCSPMTQRMPGSQGAWKRRRRPAPASQQMCCQQGVWSGEGSRPPTCRRRTGSLQALPGQLSHGPRTVAATTVPWAATVVATPWPSQEAHRARSLAWPGPVGFPVTSRAWMPGQEAAVWALVTIRGRMLVNRPHEALLPLADSPHSAAAGTRTEVAGADPGLALDLWSGATYTVVTHPVWMEEGGLSPLCLSARGALLSASCQPGPLPTTSLLISWLNPRPL